MTATRDRRRDPRAKTSALEEWGQRSAFGRAKGWPWWAGVILAFGLSVAGGYVDMKMSNDLGKVFEGAYFLSCVAAVCLVRRRNVFGPMVQAPLILAFAVPTVVLIAKGLPASGGNTSKLFALGVPLVTGFPAMAITTGATVLIGVIRYLTQRKPPGNDTNDAGEWEDGDDARRRSSDRDGERSDRAASPRRSGSGAARPSQSRTTRDEPEGTRGRTPQSSTRARGDAPPGRDGRSASGRSTSTRAAQDRGQGRDPRQARERAAGDRSASGDRGQSPRSGQSRDRGDQPPRDGRSSRDDGRRQPPRRRDDDH